MAAFVVVEDLQVLEDGVRELDLRLPAPAVEQLDLNPAQKDSALSKQSPIEPIEGTSPESRARRVNAHDVNWVPWSEWISAPGEGRRLEIALPSAFVTSAAVGEGSIDQPTTRRENTSGNLGRVTFLRHGGDRFEARFWGHHLFQ